MSEESDSPIECDCCGTENPIGGVKLYRAEPIYNSGERHLCRLCSSTYASTYHMDKRRNSETRVVLHAICVVGNEILKAVTKWVGQ